MHNGDEIAPRDMKTGHALNSLKMIWNHTAPAELRIYPYRRWDISGMPANYCRQAVIAFCRVLRTRTLSFQERETLDAIYQMARKAFPRHAALLK